MLNTTLRRVARTCPNASIPTRCATSPIAAAAGSSNSIATFSTRCHQRRHSSSKPPVPPNNGSPSIPAASVETVDTSKSSDKRADADSRSSKRKVVKGEKADIRKQMQDVKGNEWVLQMPSVPSTQHLVPKDVWVSSFFATHRPISISGPFPPDTRAEDIDKIFQSRPKRPRNGAADVIYTLSSAVQHLDENIHRGQQQGQQQNESQTVEQRADLIKALTQHNNTAASDSSQTTHLDGQTQRIQEGNVQLLLQEIAARFRPFNTPPPPVPAPEVDLLGTQQESDPAAQASKFEIEIERQGGQKVVVQVNNLRNPLNAALKAGQFFTSRPVISNPTSTTNITEPSQQPSKGGRLRRGMYVDPRRNLRNLRYYAISVKRQRKLKMKKHKYKKLMRKTRNLRRRLDRL